MKRIIIVLIVLCSISSMNAFGQKGVYHDTIEMIGKIVRENFVSKGNSKVEGVYDYFFQTNDKKYFIKEYGSVFTKEMLDKWIGIPVWLEAVVKNGLWDTTDDPAMQQSRVGEYITIFYIEKKLKD